MKTRTLAITVTAAGVGLTAVGIALFVLPGRGVPFLVLGQALLVFAVALWLAWLVERAKARERDEDPD